MHLSLFSIAHLKLYPSFKTYFELVLLKNIRCILSSKTFCIATKNNGFFFNKIKWDVSKYANDFEKSDSYSSIPEHQPSLSSCFSIYCSLQTPDIFLLLNEVSFDYKPDLDLSSLYLRNQRKAPNIL